MEFKLEVHMALNTVDSIGNINSTMVFIPIGCNTRIRILIGPEWNEAEWNTRYLKASMSWPCIQGIECGAFTGS